MKRKLFCIFFMFAGAAVIAGTILLSLGRPEYADSSPVYTLIILSIVTIIAAAWHIIEPDAPEASGRDRIFLRAFRVVGILAILVSFAFIVIMFFLTRYYTYLMRNISPLMALAIAGIAAAALSLKLRAPVSGRGAARAARCVPIIISLAITVALGFIYLNYMPKYSQEDGENLLRSKEEFAQTDVFYLIDGPGESTWAFPRWGDTSFDQYFGSNPFYDELYDYNAVSYSYAAGVLHTAEGYINFDPATRKYEYMRMEDQDKTHISGDWPKFSWNIMYDKGGRHDAVLNLFFRESWHDEGTSDINSVFSVSSGEWDAKMKDVMYPHSFPEDEARAFLGSISEEALKAKLLEQINSWGWFKDKTVEVYFFGIDIATYTNGEIVLKI